MRSNIKRSRLNILVAILLCSTSIIASSYLGSKIEKYESIIENRKIMENRREKLDEKNESPNSNIDQLEFFKKMSELSSVNRISKDYNNNKYEVELKASKENLESFIEALTKVNSRFRLDRLHYDKDKISLYFSIL